MRSLLFFLLLSIPLGLLGQVYSSSQWRWNYELAFLDGKKVRAYAFYGQKNIQRSKDSTLLYELSFSNDTLLGRDRSMKKARLKYTIVFGPYGRLLENRIRSEVGNTTKSILHWQYSSNGCLLKKEDWAISQDDMAAPDTSYSVYEYRYDNRGFKETWRKIYRDDETSLYLTYMLGDQKQLIKEIELFSNGDTSDIWVYNKSAGLLTLKMHYEALSYPAKGLYLSDSIQYEYEDGRKTKSTQVNFFDEGGIRFQRIMEFKNNPDGTRSQFTYLLSSDGKLSLEEESYWDAQGFITKVVSHWDKYATEIFYERNAQHLPVSVSTFTKGKATKRIVFYYQTIN